MSAGSKLIVKLAMFSLPYFAVPVTVTDFLVRMKSSVADPCPLSNTIFSLSAWYTSVCLSYVEHNKRIARDCQLVV